MTDPDTTPGWDGTRCNQCSRPHVSHDGHNACLSHWKSDPQHPCTNPPIHGCRTCRMHGSSTKAARAAGAKVVEVAAARRRLNIPAHVDPRAALAAELARTVAWVEWLSERVDVVPDIDLVWGTTKIVDEQVTMEAKASSWWSALTAERKHLVTVAREAHAAGVQDQWVRIETDKARLVVAAVTAIVTGLGHSMTDPAIMRLVSSQLLAIEASATHGADL